MGSLRNEPSRHTSYLETPVGIWAEPYVDLLEGGPVLPKKITDLLPNGGF